jgi:tripartite-type tricarboxylate transporter receptor subunit TctC
LVAVAFLAAAAAVSAFAEGSSEKGGKGAAAWPTGTVQVYVPAKAGGSSDIHARVFAQYMQEATGKPFVVVNQPAGGGSVSYETVRTSKPDGNTLVFTHTGIIVNYYTGVYDQPMSEFTALAILQSMPAQVYGVSPTSKWNNFKDFVDEAKANPDKVKIGVQMGATTHLIAGNIMRELGIKLKLVQAGDEVEKVAALQGGFIDIANLSAGAAAQYIQAGKMKVVGSLDNVLDPTFPQFVPVKDQGYDVGWAADMCLFGPKGMDPALVERINALTKAYGENPAVKEKLKNMASRYVYRSVAETAEYVKKEDAKIAAIAKDLGLSKR